MSTQAFPRQANLAACTLEAQVLGTFYSKQSSLQGRVF